MGLYKFYAGACIGDYAQGESTKTVKHYKKPVFAGRCSGFGLTKKAK